MNTVWVAFSFGFISGAMFAFICVILSRLRDMESQMPDWKEIEE